MSYHYTNLGEKDMHILDLIREQEEIPLLNHQLRNPMREGTKGSVSVSFGLFSKSVLFTQEMGIGKTYTAMGIIENLLRKNPNRRVLFCGTNDKLLEYVEDFKHNLSPNFKVTYCNNEESEVIRAFEELNECNVLIVTHSVWDSGVSFHKHFIPYIDYFDTFILDEGGLLLKNRNNYAYRMMEQFVPKMKYKYILDATPIHKDLNLIINQLRILDIPIPSKSQMQYQYGSTDESKFVLDNMEDLMDKLKYHTFNVSRKEVGIILKYDLNPYFFKTSKEQNYLINEDGARNLRYPFKRPELFTDDFYPSWRKLKEVCVKGARNGEHMIIYIRNVHPKIVIKDELEKLGIRVGIYDGTHTNTHEKKKYVEEAFNNGEYDVLLTNKIYGLSLRKANHVIIYDLPPNFYQFVYRAIRDLKTVNLKVSVFAYDFENDYLTINAEAHSENAQNVALNRGFTLVNDLKVILNRKADYGIYD